MKTILASLAVLVCTLASSLAAAQVTLYQQQNFVGRSFPTNGPVSDLGRMGFNDRASSAIVERGQWQVCDDIGFRGYCIVLRPGNYPSLGAMGLNDRISSVRPLDRYGRGEQREYYGERDRYSDRPYDQRYYERRSDHYDPSWQQ